MHRTLALATVACIFSISNAFAFDRRVEAILKRLDPDSRLTQACALEAMRRIDRDQNPFHPDRAMIDQLSEPTRAQHVLHGSGGAFRSGGEWYRFSFRCSAASDHLSVLSFEYKIGAKVDRKQWDALGLFK